MGGLIYDLPMMAFKALLVNQRARAFAGALALHMSVFGALVTWRPAPLPAPPETIPVLLIELSALEPPIAKTVPDPETEPEPELIVAPKVTAQFTPEPDPEPQQESEDEQKRRQLAALAAPAEKQIETDLSLDPAPPAGEVSVQAGIEALETKQRVTQDTPSQYVYQYDPFAETAPTAGARVSRAINCARANRETRPSFCPDFDEDDLFLAALGQGRPSEWERASYDPVLDIAAARSALGNFKARQIQPQFTGHSESFVQTHRHDPVVPDKDCQAVPFGFADPFALDKNVAIPDNKAVHCQ